MIPTERTDGSEENVASLEARARAFLAANVASRSEAEALPRPSRDEIIASERVLQAKIYDAGFAAITYPREYGGQGLGEAAQLAWLRASAEYAVPRVAFSVSHGMCGPIINHLGTHEQKKKYLPALWRGDLLFAQLFSEPGAGSDVAAIQTRAERVEGGWSLSGQKVWTSNAQYCDYGVIVARTDSSLPKHEGLTMFILDLHSDAVTVNPLRVASGEHPFNEIFIDAAFVPDSDVLGNVGEGWAAAITMLNFERISLGTNDTKIVGPLSFDNLVAATRDAGLIDAPGAQAALVEAYLLERGRELLSTRMREEMDNGTSLGPRGSIAKLAAATASFRLNELLGELLGADLIAWQGDGYPPIAKALVSAPGTWAAGGTIEVQKNIIGERVLGLEREPSLDKGVPFRDIRRGR